MVPGAVPPATRLAPLSVPVAVMLFALKLPLASRFTMALAVEALVGATFQFSPRVPFVVTGEPVTVKSAGGALKPTLVTVPLLAAAGAVSAVLADSVVAE
jgi:hypothetical protein